MTRTKRIYNRPTNITHLYMGDTGALSVNKGFIVVQHGCYHPYLQLCMGNCPSCRGGRPNRLKYKLRRLANKRELRRVVANDVRQDWFRHDKEFCFFQKYERLYHLSCLMSQECWCEKEDENGVVHYEQIVGQAYVWAMTVRAARGPTLAFTPGSKKGSKD